MLGVHINPKLVGKCLEITPVFNRKLHKMIYCFAELLLKLWILQKHHLILIIVLKYIL